MARALPVPAAPVCGAAGGRPPRDAARRWAHRDAPVAAQDGDRSRHRAEALARATDRPRARLVGTRPHAVSLRRLRGESADRARDGSVDLLLHAGDGLDRRTLYLRPAAETLRPHAASVP